MKTILKKGNELLKQRDDQTIPLMLYRKIFNNGGIVDNYVFAL